MNECALNNLYRIDDCCVETHHLVYAHVIHILEGAGGRN